LRSGELILKAQDGVWTERDMALPHTTHSVWQGYGSDTLGEGVQREFKRADSKRYDSKSQYERAVKAKGCRIVGNDYNGKIFNRELQGNFNPAPQLKEAYQKVMNK